MIVLAFVGGILVLGIVAAVFYDRRARRRGLRPGVSPRDIRHGGGGGGGGGNAGP
jgi:hypothetical protein